MKDAVFHAGLLFVSLWGAGLWTATRAPLLSAERVQSLRDSARAALAQGRHAAALLAAQALLRRYPRSHIYLEIEAEALRGLRDFRHEAAAWELYMEAAPFPASACPHLGRAYAAQGLEEKSLDAHARCLSLDKDDADLSFYYGQALARAGRNTEAEGLFLKILARHPRYSDALVALARLRLEQGKLSESQALLQRALAAVPSHPDAWLVYGMHARRQGDKPASKERLKKAIAAAPAYADLYRVLGRWLSEDGEAAEAARVNVKLAELEGGQ